MSSNDEWATFSKVKHRLQMLDSPDPAGWTLQELVAEYHCSARWMRDVLSRLVQEGFALKTRDDRYIGSGKLGVGQ